jgi:hypothetical protein
LQLQTLTQLRNPDTDSILILRLHTS